MHSEPTVARTRNTPLWGKHTESSLDHYVSGPDLNSLPSFTNTYIRIKKACAAANFQHAELSADRYEAIAKACRWLLQQDNLEHFPSPLMSGGGWNCNKHELE